MSDVAGFLRDRLNEDEAEAFTTGPLPASQRLYREVEAKRLILTDHLACIEWNYTRLERPDICVTLRAMAAVYADHPGYDPAWSMT